MKIEAGAEKITVSFGDRNFFRYLVREKGLSAIAVPLDFSG